MDTTDPIREPDTSEPPVRRLPGGAMPPRTDASTSTRQPRAIHRSWRLLLAPGFLFTVASLVLMVVAVVAGGPDDSPYWLVAALAGSTSIFWSAVSALRSANFTAAVPVAIALAAALLSDMYFPAALIAFFLLVGERLEDLVAARATRSVEALAGLLPTQVTVRRSGGDSIDRDTVVALDDIVVGDVCLVRSGERIAVDGEVVSGTASVNQAAITGETTPVDKAPGDTILAGSLVEIGALTIHTARVGDETKFGQIRLLTAAARRQQAPVERLLNRYARVFTPAMMLAGLGAWIVTHDVSRAISLLILWCPCIIPLTTPMALSATITNVARRGTLVKRSAIVEVLAKVDVVCFDKTGTLTLGQPRLVECVALDGIAELDVLRLTATAEKLSEHPIAQALVGAATDRSIVLADPEDFRSLPGLGVAATVDGARVVAGRAALLEEQGVPIPTEVAGVAEALAGSGRTVIVVARDAEAVGVLAFEDTLRPEAAAAVSRLHNLSVRTVMVTGDNRPAAERVARQLEITELHAEVLPDQKVEVVRRLHTAGHRVIFVGDGINDGPVLATADAGVSMGGAGTDLANETADISLLSDDLSNLPHLVSASRSAIRAIKLNAAFLVATLSITVALAIAGGLTPIGAAAVHGLLSIPAVANSARLVRGGDGAMALLPRLKFPH